MTSMASPSMENQGTKYGKCVVVCSMVVIAAGPIEIEMAPSRSSTGAATKLKSSRSKPWKLHKKLKKMGMR